MSQQIVTLLLGSNLGDPEKNIRAAIQIIENEIGSVQKMTKILKTEAVEFVSNNIFCNIAIVIKTQFSPIKLLNLIKNIERNMGRTDDTMISKAYSDRIIDIDIVLFGNVLFECKRLQIPHYKHVYRRDFSRKLLEMLSQP